MNCKNCNTNLQDASFFCHTCGAKVITQRINTKVLIAEFMLSYIGWDNRFLLTLRSMVLRPATVISDYLNGIRSRYMAPIVFVGLGVAIGTIIFNIYSEEYLEFVDSAGRAQMDMVQENFNDGELSQKQFDSQRESLELTRTIQEYLLKYLNIFSFIMLPFYALISRIVFGSKYNYGEHLVINCYIQGLSFFMGVIFFLVGIYIYPPLYYFQLIVLFFYYLWTFAKLMNFGVGKAIVKLLLFLGIMLLFSIVFFVIGMISVLIVKF